LQGFLSYQDPVEIDFTGFDLACITGENGAGKSSILDAFTWVLFGRARRNDESLINLNSKEAVVSLVFDYEGNRYRVTRSDPRGETKQLEFSIQEDQADDQESAWLPLSERTIRDTDQKITEILRLDYESFVNASFFLQGEADLFTQQNPAARKRILSQILGLEVWEVYRRRAGTKRKATENEINRLDGRLTEINTELAEEEGRKEQLVLLEEKLSEAINKRRDAEQKMADHQAILASLEEQKRLVQTLEDQAELIKQNTSQVEDKIKIRESEREEYEAVLQDAARINQDHRAWQEARKSLAEWEKIAVQFHESELKRQEPQLQIAAEKARLLQEKTSLETQFQKMNTELDRLPGLSKELGENNEAIRVAEKQLKTRADKVNELEIARQNQADAKAENPLLFQEMKTLEKRIRDLKAADGALCPLCGQELAEDEREALVKTLQVEGKEMGDRYRKNQATLKKADRVVKDLQLQITELSLAENTLRGSTKDADRIENQISTLEEKRSSWDKNGQAVLQELNQHLEKEDYAAEARKKLSTLNAELKKIGYDANEHDRVRELTDQGGVIQDQKAALDRSEAALQPLTREIKDLTDQKNKKGQDLKKLEAEIASSRKNLAAGEEKAPDTKSLGVQLLDLKEDEKVLEREAGAAQQKVTVLKTQKTRKKALESQRQNFAGDVKLYKQLEGAFGKDGVPALLIEQALPNIEAKANQILNKLSGGSMSIRIMTQREYKDKGREDQKETLDIQIRDQSGYRDYELYSGGESFRINFAIRLALSHVLAQRAGAKLQTLVIDEGFGSQDIVGRQRLIEAINLIQDDFEKILVITHVNQIKEAFSTQLLVEKSPRGSSVTLV